MLTTNSVKESDKHYSLLKKCFNQFKEQLYKDTGLELVQTSTTFKLQLADDDHRNKTFSSNFEYGMYFLILAALISEAKNAIIPMETLATQVLEASPDMDQNRDLIFKKVIKKVELDGIITIKNEYDSDGNKYQVVIKKNNPSIYFGETQQAPISNTTKIVQYLLTHQSMNKLEHKNLWKNQSITDIRRQLDPYSNDEFGYEVYTNGDVVRLISKNDVYAFPRNKASHLVAIDFMCNYQNNETLDSFIEKSIYKSQSLTEDDVLNVIKSYDLPSINLTTN